MKTNFFLRTSVLLGWLAGSAGLAQTYVTPMLGGGQVAANMAHIDLSYDADGNVLSAHVDDSEGIPELRALAAGLLFDPDAPYAVLNGAAYNAQYGWNPSGFWTIPSGAAIWIEITNASPGLEFYEEFGIAGGGSYAPILGTAGSPLRWRWIGRMVHNIVAIRGADTDRYAADYHVYFGDPATGSRAGFTHLDDTFVHLEWTTIPVEAPNTFKFGARAETNGAPLVFLNGESYLTTAGFLVNLGPTNNGPAAGEFVGGLPMLAVPGTPANGGPAPNHAALGSCVELQLVSLAGPRPAQLTLWETNGTQRRSTVPTGEQNGTNRIRLTAGAGAGSPGSDPFGRLAGRRFSVNQPGLYRLGFRLVDTSTNGLGGGPIHAASEVCQVYLQAGCSIASLARQGPATTVVFGGKPGVDFHLERTPTLGASTLWQTVAGPLTGTNHIQSLTDPAATIPQGFYRLRVEAH